MSISLLNKRKLWEIQKRGLKIPRSLRSCRFDSDLRHQMKSSGCKIPFWLATIFFWQVQLNSNQLPAYIVHNLHLGPQRFSNMQEISLKHLNPYSGSATETGTIPGRSQSKVDLPSWFWSILRNCKLLCLEIAYSLCYHVLKIIRAKTLQRNEYWKGFGINNFVSVFITERSGPWNIF